MSEYKQITNLDDLAGKTIVRAKYLEYTDVIGIVFEDGTYLNLHADSDYEGGISIMLFRSPDLGHKIDLGIATEQEIARKRQYDELNDQRKKQRRAEYERLRAEFEGEEGSTLGDAMEPPRIVSQEPTPLGVRTTYDDGHIRMIPYRINKEGRKYFVMFLNEEEDR